MNSPNENDREHQLQDVTKALFTGVAPERQKELEAFWNDFSVQFKILDDGGPDGSLVMDAGGYVYIRFNHRIMRLFWLSGFLLWEAYCALHHFSITGKTDIARFKELLDCFEATRVANDVDAVAWPTGIPMPGELVEHKTGDPGRVGGELAIFAVSWALLHELRHLIHQQKGTSAPMDDKERSREEELSCDDFATTFLLERCAEYASSQAANPSIVCAKRQTGVYCALFAVTLLTRGNWDRVDTHPALQTRIDNVLNKIESLGLSRVATLIAASAFGALKLEHPSAPDPIQRVTEIAERENWTPLDELF